MAIIDTENINNAIEAQLMHWPLAKENYDRLRECRRRTVKVGDMEVGVQCNPARIRSTGADISKNGIEARPCFLCKDNRPKEQMTADIAEGWEMLVNPYPIFPVHFTIASKEHVAQDRPPLDMLTVAESLPSLCIFFNGAHAGASAPDHMHMQAVLKSELPIIKIAESFHTAEKGGIVDSADFPMKLPFRFLSAVITPDEAGMKTLARMFATTGSGADGKPDPGLVNTYFWMDTEAGLMRGIVIPRRAHRPKCYTAEVEERILVSPGAIDMAGIIITPRPEDFEKITSADVERIYREVALQ